MNAEPLSPPADLPERLQLYARYVTLVAEQLEAIRQQSPQALAELEAERRRVERRLNEVDAERPDPAAAAGLGEFLDIGIAALQQDVQAREELQERWSKIRDGALRSARTVGRSGIRGGRYPAMQMFENQLDRRF